MLKIKAKQLLFGKLLQSFSDSFFSRLISAFGLALFLISVYFSYDNRLITRFLPSAADYSEWVFVIIYGIIGSFGLLVFAYGRKLLALKSVSRSKVSLGFALTGTGIKMTFDFLLMSVMKFLFSLAWGFLFGIPFSLCAYGAYYTFKSGEMTSDMLLPFAAGMLGFGLFGLFFTFAVMQRYAMWQFFLLTGRGVMNSLKLSEDNTEGRCMKIAFFRLSLLPWILTGALILPLVYVLPYYDISVSLMLFESEKKEGVFENTVCPAVFRVIGT